MRVVFIIRVDNALPPSGLDPRWPYRRRFWRSPAAAPLFALALFAAYDSV
jgi:hypothetical protein